MWSSAWRVEGQHARTKRGVTQATNHRAAYVSLCHRLPELRSFLKQDTSGLTQLAEIFKHLTRRVAIARQVGLSLRHAVDAGWLTGRISNHAIALLFHDDPFTKYTLPLPATIKLQGCEEFSLSTDHAETGPAHEVELAFQACTVRHTHALQALKGLVKTKRYYPMPLKPKALFTLRSLIALRAQILRPFLGI